MRCKWAVLLDLEDKWPVRVLSHISFEKHHAECDLDDHHPFTLMKCDSYVFRMSGFPIAF
ncbi:MAG TPA: hypothetical protein PKI62_00955 [bacterium]|nr:hypothetical protein [bacterium]HPR86808.1 hypothetical protein [bacterium]